MKKYILILSAFVLFIGTSCKSKEKLNNDNTNKTAQTEQKARLVVSFFSIGTGVDSDAYARLEKFVNGHSKKPSFTKSNWGREGEMDVAFSLKEFKSSEQTKFIEELKKAIGDSDRVRYSENEVPKSRK